MKKIQTSLTRRPTVIHHVVDTWLIANAVHVVLLLTMFFPSISKMGFNSFGLVLLFAMIITAISLPCLMMAYYCLEIIARGLASAKVLFLVWLIVCPAIVLAEGLLGVLLLKDATAYSITACVPAMIAVFLTVLIRYPHFVTLISYYKKYPEL